MNEQDFEPAPPEDEALPVGKLLLAAGTAVLIFGVAIGIAWWMTQAGSDSTVPRFKPEVGIVFQRPFALEKSAAQLKAEQQQTLSSTGWVDRDQRLVHIPLERAIDELVAGQPRENTR